MSLDKDQFIARVASIVLVDMPADATDHDRETVRWSAETAWDAGADIHDAVAYCRTFEEVNPALDEEIALGRRFELRVKYEGKERDRRNGRGMF